MLFFLSLTITLGLIIALFYKGSTYGMLTKFMFYLLNVPLYWMSFTEFMQFLVFVNLNILRILSMESPNKNLKCGQWCSIFRKYQKEDFKITWIKDFYSTSKALSWLYSESVDTNLKKDGQNQVLSFPLLSPIVIIELIGRKQWSIWFLSCLSTKTEDIFYKWCKETNLKWLKCSVYRRNSDNKWWPRLELINWTNFRFSRS